MEAKYRLLFFWRPYFNSGTTPFFYVTGVNHVFWITKIILFILKVAHLHHQQRATMCRPVKFSWSNDTQPVSKKALVLWCHLCGGGAEGARIPYSKTNAMLRYLPLWLQFKQFTTWAACQLMYVGEATGGFENELWRSWCDGRVGEWTVT